jgi:hypothetical protein
MNTQQLSRDQLAELVKSLENAEHTQTGDTSLRDFKLSQEGLEELVQRLAAFDDGKLTVRSWNDIIKDFGPI